MKTISSVTSLLFVLVPFCLFTLSQSSPAQWISSGLANQQVNALAVSGTNLFAGTGSGVYITSDSGATWILMNSGLADTNVHALFVLDTILYAGTSGGVFRSTNKGINWNGINSGLTNPVVQALAGSTGPSGYIYAGTNNGLFRLSVTDSIWYDITAGISKSDIRSLGISGPNLLAGAWYGGVFLSSNAGSSWSSVNYSWLNYIHVFAVNSVNFFAGGDSGVSVSTDNGVSWTNPSTGPPSLTTVFALAQSGTNLFAGDLFGVFRSSNNGTSWTSANTGLSNNIVVSLVVSGINIFAGTSGQGIWRRTVTQPAEPTLVSPLTGVVNQPPTLTFIWEQSPGAEHYHLQVAEDSLFVNMAFSDSSIIDTFQQVGPLSYYHKYYWRVSAVNVAGEGPHSQIRHFATMIASPASLIASAANQGITIHWAPGSAGVLRYRIYRGQGSPVFTLRDSTVADSVTYRDSALTNGTTYYYRLTAVDSQLVETGFSNVANATPFNQAPVAVTISDVNIPNAGRSPTTQLTFSSAGSVDPDGTIDSIYWYVDNNLVGRQQEMTHNYGPGFTRVMLIVEDNNNAKDTTTATVRRSVFRLATNGLGYVGMSLLGDSLLYAVSAGDAIYRLDINGNTLYTIQVGGSVLSASSVAYDTTVYIASTDRNLYAFSRYASPVWPALPLGGVLSATAAVDSVENRVYIGVQNRNFFAVNRTTGLVAWSYFSNAPIMNSAVITSDRKLVFSTQAGTVYGFDLANLPAPVSPAWTLSLGDTITTSPAIDAAGFFYVGTKSGKIVKISMQQGSQAAIVWQAQTGSPVYASPVIDGNGNLYVGSLDSRFYAIRTADGGIKWSLQSSGPIRSTAAISNSGVTYFGNDAGQLYAVDSMSNVKWKYLHPSPISAPLLYHAGTLYMAGEDAVILAFFDGEDPFTESPIIGNRFRASKTSVTKVPVWGTFQGNNQRTGAQIAQTGTGVSSGPPMLPTKYSLSQNFPNPFNPSTVIRYDIPGASQVVLKVYNIFGQEVSTLVNDRKAAGSYSVTFDAGSRLASGLYFYRLQAGTFIDAKKLLLVK